MNEIQQKILCWEQQQYKKILKKMYAQKQYRGNPREKAFQDFRHHRLTGHWYKKEAKYTRKMTNRKFRRMLKRNLYHKAYYKPRNRDYHTYGWLTW